MRLDLVGSVGRTRYYEPMDLFALLRDSNSAYPFFVPNCNKKLFFFFLVKLIFTH